MADTIPVVIPEFSSLKAGFIEYLQQKPEYADYNFTGSALSTLIDIHALNSHYLAFFLNQVANEAFLKTAIKRSSIVGRANSLGYIGRTASSARATVQIQYIKDSSSLVPFTPITINNPTFVSTFLNQNYIFSSTDPITIRESNGVYVSPEFEIFEGKRFIYSQTLTSDILTNGFVIPNVNVDINHVDISITENSVTTNYSLISNIVEADNLTKGFFYYENSDGRLVIEFGDNVIGYKPAINSVMTISYLVCSGSDANGIDTFVLSNIPSSMTGNFIVKVVQTSTGGDEVESADSIKKLAPLSFSTQNRAVIDSDYATLLKAKYPNIADVVTYSGSELDPPKYGKVIVVVKQKTGLYLTTYDKESIKNFLKSYNVMTATPIIVEPDYIYINATVNVLFDYSKLVGTTTDLRDRIATGISNFESVYLNGFNRDFRYSTFLRSIDFSDKSIIANTTSITLEKKLIPILGTKTFIDTSFNNKITPGTLLSSTFTYGGKTNCFIDDSVNGILTIYRYNNGLKNVVAANFGTIDYTTGRLNIPTITIDSLDNVDNINTQTNEKYLSFYADPVNFDIIISQNNVGLFNNVVINLSN